MSTTGTERVSADHVRHARLALRAAHYDAALELLEDCEDWPVEFAERAITLKAEALSRRDPVAAVGYLATVEDIPTSAEGRFAFALESSRALGLVRDFDAAARRLNDARALTGSVEHGAERLASYELRLRWNRRQCDVDDPCVTLALTNPDPTLAASAWQIRAWMHAHNGRFTQQVADLKRSAAFATSPGPEPADVNIIGASVYALAQTAFELADGEGVAAARTAFEALPWTPDIQTSQFLSLRAFGYDDFMRGRAGQAQWTFKDARGLAPSAEWRVLAHLDRAYVARMMRNEVWAIEELAEADRLAREIRWESNFDEARQILVILAVLHAPVDAVRAQRYAAIYSKVGLENVDPRLAVHGDPRTPAFIKYAQGRIDQTLGRRDSAITLLGESYEIFERAGYHYRATLAASALAELTADGGWIERAHKHAAAYPDCPLAAVVDEAVAREEAMPSQLTALQRQIARAIFTGADAQDLSKRFSRSLYTIEKQIAAVYAAFGVASKGALMDEARRRRLI